MIYMLQAPRTFSCKSCFVLHVGIVSVSGPGRQVLPASLLPICLQAQKRSRSLLPCVQRATRTSALSPAPAAGTGLGGSTIGAGTQRAPRRTSLESRERGMAGPERSTGAGGLYGLPGLRLRHTVQKIEPLALRKGQRVASVERGAADRHYTCRNPKRFPKSYVSSG